MYSHDMYRQIENGKKVFILSGFGTTSVLVIDELGEMYWTGYEEIKRAEVCKVDSYIVGLKLYAFGLKVEDLNREKRNIFGRKLEMKRLWGQVFEEDKRITSESMALGVEEMLETRFGETEYRVIIEESMRRSGLVGRVGLQKTFKTSDRMKNFILKAKMLGREEGLGFTEEFRRLAKEVEAQDGGFYQMKKRNPAVTLWDRYVNEVEFKQTILLEDRMVLTERCLDRLENMIVGCLEYGREV